MAVQNTIFALFAVSNASAVQAKLSSTLPFALLSTKVSSDSWFLVAPPAITTQEISSALGITDGTSGNGVIVRVENYYGRISTAIWEWLSAKRGIELVQPQI
jgi:hypothetical protein